MRIRGKVKFSQTLRRFLLIGIPQVFLVALLSLSEKASAESCLNVSGTWDVHSYVDATDCGEGQYYRHDVFTVVQDGCSVDVVKRLVSYSGTVSGNQVRLWASYLEDGGTTNETVNLTVDGSILSGLASWTWSGFVASCSGTTQISGTIESPPADVATLEGTVKNATTGQPVAQALITLSPGGYQVSAGTDGFFSVSSLPPGTYTVQVSASLYATKTFLDLTLSGSITHQLNVSLVPFSPQILYASASPPVVGNDGQSTTHLSVHVTHPLGLSSISSVFGDLSRIGGSAFQAFYDDASNGDGAAGDGIYTSRVTVAKGIAARLYAINVTVFDRFENAGLGSISLNVIDKVTGSLRPSQSDLKIFENTLGGQDLNIHFAFLKTVLGLKTVKSECQVQVTIYDPNGAPYGTYYGTDDIDINIPNAAGGQWKYEIVSQCGSALSYEIETNGAGTGMLVGRVTDGFSSAGVAGASITCSTGGATVSLDQGYYSGVAVAGTGQVITTKTEYQTNIKNGVHVKAGATTSLNIQIVPQDASGQAVPSGQNTYQVLDPSGDPNPPAQPFAAKVSGSNLEFNALFPRYEQAVDLYLGFTINAPQHAGKLYLLNEEDELVDFAGTLVAWRTGTTKSEGAQVLISAISGTIFLGDYTLYALVTTDSATLSNFDLSHFTTTLAKPPPAGQNVTAISKPLTEPNPMTQPLAAKVTGGNLVLNAHFPLQADPVTVYLGCSAPAGELFLFKQDLSVAPYTGTLLPWRQEVTAEQSAQILSTPTEQMNQGTYHFYALVTADPLSLSNFDLTWFSLEIDH